MRMNDFSNMTVSSMTTTCWCRDQESEQQPSIPQTEYVKLPTNHEGTVFWDPCQVHTWVWVLSLGPVYVEELQRTRSSPT